MAVIVLVGVGAYLLTGDGSDAASEVDAVPLATEDDGADVVPNPGAWGIDVLDPRDRPRTRTSAPTSSSTSAPAAPVPPPPPPVTAPTTTAMAPPAPPAPSTSENLVVVVNDPPPQPAGSIRVCRAMDEGTEDVTVTTPSGEQVAESPIGRVDVEFVGLAPGRYEVWVSFAGEPEVHDDVELGGGVRLERHDVTVPGNGRVTVQCEK